MFPSFVRQPTGEYDVLSSSGKYYYEVQMLGVHAASCGCERFQRGRQTCKHMELAEREEAHRVAELAPLNGPAGFSLLK
jgi:hypothetical protein